MHNTLIANGISREGGTSATVRALLSFSRGARLGTSGRQIRDPEGAVLYSSPRCHPSLSNRRLNWGCIMSSPSEVVINGGGHPGRHEAKHVSIKDYNPATAALHADDPLNIVDDVAPPMHVSTTYRYPQDPESLFSVTERGVRTTWLTFAPSQIVKLRYSIHRLTNTGALSNISHILPPYNLQHNPTRNHPHLPPGKSCHYLLFGTQRNTCRINLPQSFSCRYWRWLSWKPWRHCHTRAPDWYEEITPRLL